ncbi:MAG: hypothetical protein V3S84_04265, partial [Dehalococcoidales bacterium]
IGVLFFLMPWGIPAYLAIFGLTLLLTHYPTLSYSVAFPLFPIYCLASLPLMGMGSFLDRDTATPCN